MWVLQLPIDILKVMFSHHGQRKAAKENCSAVARGSWVGGVGACKDQSQRPRNERCLFPVFLSAGCWECLNLVSATVLVWKYWKSSHVCSAADGSAWFIGQAPCLHDTGLRSPSTFISTKPGTVFLVVILSIPFGR